jgi:hypothetical protein
VLIGFSSLSRRIIGEFLAGTGSGSGRFDVDGETASGVDQICWKLNSARIWLVRGNQSSRHLRNERVVPTCVSRYSASACPLSFLSLIYYDFNSRL